MKALKLALIGSAALAAASVSARADDLNALKAQIETLNARVASLEATPAVPAGYQAVSFTKNENGEHVISVMPTADAPAAATITWTGYVRAAAVTSYNAGNYFGSTAAAGTAGIGAGQYSNDIVARAYLTVVGTTDTAVGEIGARINFMANTAGLNQSNGQSGLTTDGYVGWWKLTPNLTLSGGVGGSLSKNNFSFDANCNCYYTDYRGAVQAGPIGDAAFIRLGYSDGPLGIAIQVEDANNTLVNGNVTSGSALGVSAKATYSSDIFSADISGGYWGNGSNNLIAGPAGGPAVIAGPGQEAAWVIDGGLGAKFGMISIGAALGTGTGYGLTDNFTKVSGYAIASLSDAASIQLGVTHVWQPQLANADYNEYDAGIYYTPVKQLTLGIEGMYIGGNANGGAAGGPVASTDGAYVGSLVSIFRF